MTSRLPAPKAPSAWRRWRAARPFSGGLLVALAGAEILLAVRAPLPVVMHVGMQGLIGYLVPVLLLLCGMLLLFNPAQRLFYSTIAAVFALASWVTSNLGGFLLGLILGLIGSALAFAWSPHRGRRAPRGPVTARARHRLDDGADQDDQGPAEPVRPERSVG
jgi:hypothetical protein